jgi:uncharacterized membrane protein YkvA (DUF1232 family)
MDNKNKDKNIIPSQGNIMADLVTRVKLIARLMVDKRVNIFLKLIPVGALVYLISPIDLAPGAALPVVGALDDAAVLWLASYFFIELCPSDVVAEIARKFSGNNEMVNNPPPDPEDVVDGEVTDITDK